MLNLEVLPTSPTVELLEYRLLTVLIENGELLSADLSEAIDEWTSENKVGLNATEILADALECIERHLRAVSMLPRPSTSLTVSSEPEVTVK